MGVSAGASNIMSPESNDDVLLNLKDIELTLSLPGTTIKTTTTTATKRGFSDMDTTLLGLHLGTTTSSSSTSTTSDSANNNEFQVVFLSSSSSTSKPPPPKAQVAGWPPVRANRKNEMMKGCKYVKVAVDGAPYLRKVDLDMYDSYHHLLTALESMFSCLTIRNDLKERKLMEAGNGSEYMPTYEDKDGDWMLVGDVPWKMFVESCKRIRLMIKSEATVGLGPRTASKSTGSS